MTGWRLVVSGAADGAFLPFGDGTTIDGIAIGVEKTSGELLPYLQ